MVGKISTLGTQDEVTAILTDVHAFAEQVELVVASTST